jgi:hypothetical protein
MKMEVFMKDISKIIKRMDGEHSKTHLERNILESGRMIESMEKEK